MRCILNLGGTTKRIFALVPIHRDGSIFFCPRNCKIPKILINIPHNPPNFVNHPKKE